MPTTAKPLRSRASRQAVLFDFDGVLVTGSNEAYFPVYHEAFQAVGHRLTLQEERALILEYWSWPSSHFFRHVFQGDPDRAEKAIEIYRAALFSGVFLDALSVDPGLSQVLGRLCAGGRRLGVVSGANADLLGRVLAHHGLAPHFGCVLSGYEFPLEWQKPAPDMLLDACGRLGVEAAAALYVGDSDTDLQAAHRAGMPFCAVLTGNLTRERSEELGAEWIVPSASDVEQALQDGA